MNGILGIVAEYNPFHNGHLKHLNYSKQITKCDFTIAVMSGNFTQRGDTSLVDKWTKAEMAVKAGVDLVIELPTIYATSSAENFASGAIKILNSLGIVDYISFGSEAGDITLLDNIASILYKEPKEFSKIILQQLKSGLSYPQARELAISLYFGTSQKYTETLENPNNILGIEYLKALKRQKSLIKPITIQREYSNYNSKKVTNKFASSTAIRAMIETGKNISSVVPINTYEVLEKKKKQHEIIKNLSVFEKQIIYILRKMSVQEIAKLPDVSEGLEYRIKEAVNLSNNLENLISNIKTKRYTETRIRRILIYSLLGITKKDMNISKRALPYIRILAFNSHGKHIISALAKNNPKTKVIISVKKFMERNFDPSLTNIMLKDILATNIYTLGYEGSNVMANLDYTHKITVTQ